jgi:hypothetical protein
MQYTEKWISALQYMYYIYNIYFVLRMLDLCNGVAAQSTPSQAGLNIMYMLSQYAIISIKKIYVCVCVVAICYVGLSSHQITCTVE